MRANILASMGLKESDLAAMDPKQRQAVEDQIENRSSKPPRSRSTRRADSIPI
jgi:hypothetical protein